MRRVSTRTLVAVGVAVSLVIAGVVSFYASTHPDGLEYVASHTGFGGTARKSLTSHSPLSGYEVSWLGDGRLSGGVAGVVGVLVVGLLALGLVRFVRRHSGDED